MGYLNSRVSIVVTVALLATAASASTPIDVDALWDVDVPKEGEVRLRQAEIKATGADLLEIRAAIARSLMLQGRLDEAQKQLDVVGSMLTFGDRAGNARYLIERGRLHDVRRQFPLALLDFENAFRIAQAAQDDSLAVDAANAAAIVTRTDPKSSREWLSRALSIAKGSKEAGVVRLMPSLNNNMGWAMIENGECTGAVPFFQAASALWQKEAKAMQIGFAEVGVAQCERESGRTVDAFNRIKRAKDIAAQAGDAALSGEVEQEMGEILAAMGNKAEAKRSFENAARDFSQDPRVMLNDPTRITRIMRRSQAVSTP